MKVRVTTNNSKFWHKLVSMQMKERHNTEGDIQLTSAEIQRTKINGATGGNPDDDVYGAVFENELPLGTYEVIVGGNPTGAIITVAKSTATPSPSASVTPSAKN